MDWPLVALPLYGHKNAPYVVVWDFYTEAINTDVQDVYLRRRKQEI